MSETFKPAEGGCLCGALRYRIEKAPKVVDICHCWQCRKASGAPFVGWLGVPADGLRWTKGTPAKFESSPDTWRLFCANCGSPVAMTGGSAPDLHGVNIGSLDEPQRFTPTDEGWASQCLPWARLAHPLRSHDRDNPGF
jgi:hypothetical protein